MAHHHAYLDLAATEEARRMAYRALFDNAIRKDTLDGIRGAVRHNHLVGSERFREQVAAMLGRRLGNGRPGRPRGKPTSGNSTAET